MMSVLEREHGHWHLGGYRHACWKGDAARMCACCYARLLWRILKLWWSK